MYIPVVDVQYNQAVTKYRFSRSINQTFIHVMVTKLIVTGWRLVGSLVCFS